MITKCGVRYDAGVEKPESAKFALWYLGNVKFFTTREEAQSALDGLPPRDRQEATISELPK
jgi:hypothetical protein